jgi:hypothetical protein
MQPQPNSLKGSQRMTRLCPSLLHKLSGTVKKKKVETEYLAKRQTEDF